LKPDAIHLSSCLVTAKPACPYGSAEQFAQMLKDKFQIPVILGTHEYH
jgi:predicted metal-binding protein